MKYWFALLLIGFVLLAVGTMIVNATQTIIELAPTLPPRVP